MPEIRPAMSALLTLFENLRRGVAVERIETLVDAALEPASGAALEDVCVLAVHTRWCRGGKGERRAALDVLLVLYTRAPAATLAVAALLPEFGSWRDVVTLGQDAAAHGATHEPLSVACWDMLAHELQADAAALYAASAERGAPPSLSLAAKYAPSECGARGAVRGDLELCRRLFDSTATHARRDYRRLLTHLRRALALPEPLMCAGRWDDIHFADVPARALACYKRAFLNEGRGGPRAEPARIRCRERFLAALADPANIKGAQMFPHELVREAMRPGLSPGVEAVLNAQWAAVRASVQDIGLGTTRMVCMADVSGSMLGTPMHVSIALGILVAELSHPDFRDRVLTFSAEPTWHLLRAGDSFVAKVRSLAAAPWGHNTNLTAAVDMVAEVVAAKGLKQGAVPDLLVVSDMRFDESQRGQDAWGVAHESISERFSALGTRLHGARMQPPRIVFWNVRADGAGFEPDAGLDGVALLSGYSPALMRAFLAGEEKTLPAPGGCAAVRTTAADTLRAVLEDPALQCVRTAARTHSHAPPVNMPHDAPPAINRHEYLVAFAVGLVWASCVLTVCIIGALFAHPARTR